MVICQHGGDFVSGSDGSMAYSGGEAHVIDIDSNTNFDGFKAEITNAFNIDISTMVIKYFLPNNKRTLITVSHDKDLRRMIDLNANSATLDVFVLHKVDNRYICLVISPLYYYFVNH